MGRIVAVGAVCAVAGAIAGFAAGIAMAPGEPPPGTAVPAPAPPAQRQPSETSQPAAPRAKTVEPVSPAERAGPARGAVSSATATRPDAAISPDQTAAHIAAARAAIAARRGEDCSKALRELQSDRSREAQEFLAGLILDAEFTFPSRLDLRNFQGSLPAGDGAAALAAAARARFERECNRPADAEAARRWLLVVGRCGDDASDAWLASLRDAPGDRGWVRHHAVIGLADGAREVAERELWTIWSDPSVPANGFAEALRAFVSRRKDRAVPFLERLIREAFSSGAKRSCADFLRLAGDHEPLRSFASLVDSANAAAAADLLRSAPTPEWRLETVSTVQVLAGRKLDVTGFADVVAYPATVLRAALAGDADALRVARSAAYAIEYNAVAQTPEALDALDAASALPHWEWAKRLAAELRGRAKPNTGW